MRKRTGWEETAANENGLYCQECLKLRQNCICGKVEKENDSTNKDIAGGTAIGRKKKRDIPDQELTCSRCDTNVPNRRERRYCYGKDKKDKIGFHYFCLICEPYSVIKKGFIEL